MEALGRGGRASFVYENNESFSDEIKEALASFDLNKSGMVHTSELVAGAKALEEVRDEGGVLARVIY